MTLSPLTADSLRETAHGFFTRKGGTSSGTYESLNCGPGSSDDPKAVTENRARVAQTLGISPDALMSVHQIHSPDVITLEAPITGDRPKADAMVTKTKGIGLGVLLSLIHI